MVTRPQCTGVGLEMVVAPSLSGPSAVRTSGGLRGRTALRDPRSVTRSRRLAMAVIAAALVLSGCGAGEPETLASLHIDPTASPSAKPPTAGELAAQAFYARVQGGKLTYHATLR